MEVHVLREQHAIVGGDGRVDDVGQRQAPQRGHVRAGAAQVLDEDAVVVGRVALEGLVVVPGPAIHDEVRVQDHVVGL